MPDIPDNHRSTNDGSTTTPLGGRSHRHPSLTRSWPGNMALIRVCPECEFNAQEYEPFCPDCGADLRDVAPQSAQSEAQGRAWMAARLRRDDIRRRRERAITIRGGSGWITVAVILIFLATMMTGDPTVRLILWSAGVVSGIFGLVSIRSDPGALRTVGMFIVVSGIALISLITWRTIDGDDTILGLPPAEEVIATPEATPDVAMGADATAATEITAEVPMDRGDLLRTGQQPGPAPTSNPSLVWRVDTGGAVTNTPVLADSMLFVTTRGGDVLALDAASGSEIWRANVSNDIIRSSPTVHGETVFVAAGFTLHALDSSNGETRWSASLRYANQGTPTVVDDVVYVASQEGWTYAYDVDSGESLWRVTSNGVISSPFAVTEEDLIATSDTGIVTAADRETGRQSWRRELGSALYASPAFTEDAVIITASDGSLHALDRQSGEIRWTTPAGGNRAPAIDGELVISAASDGGVYGIDADTGETVWLYPSGTTSASEPSISDDLAILGSGSSLIALDTQTGEVVWTYLAGGPVQTAPVVANGYAFFGSDDGFLYAISDQADD